MRIVVCVKYVPVLSALRFDAATRRLVREGVPGEVSSFDVRALGAATALRAAHGGEVVALTMGPPSAREALVHCLALGADRAVHLLDPLLAGSDTLATEGAAIEPVDVTRGGEVLAGDSPEALARALREKLVGLGALDRAGEAGEPLPSRARASGSPVWVVAELGVGGLRPVTRELLAKAAALAARLGGPVEAIVIGPGSAEAPVLAAAGADRVLVAEGPGLDPYTTEAHAAVLADAIRARGPRLVLLGSTALGRDLAPRVAARLGLGLTGDAIDLDVAADGRVRQHKPAFGGSIVAPILSRTRPEMATVRPGMLRPAAPDPSRTPVVERLAVPPLATRVTTLRRDPLADAAASLDSARLVLGVGKGIGGPGGLAAVRDAAARLGPAIAATRDVTDAGWLPKQHQVGLTGRAIAPRVYVALGVSGAMEHLVGIRRAGVIVA